MIATKILIVDDEQDLVWAVRYTLVDEGFEVHTAHNGAAGLSLARNLRPDLIILDIVMPEMDGVQVCHALRRDTMLASTPILFLTMRNSIEDRIRGLNDGADDYLVKPFDFGELKARVRALLRRAGRSHTKDATQNTQLVHGDIRLDLRTHEVIVGSRTVSLTPAEYDLLRHFMTHRGQMFSSDQLLQQVWGYPPDSLAHGLVRWHMMNLRNKIEADPHEPRYVRTVPRHGYIMPDSLC